MHLWFLLVGAAIFLLWFSLETIADYQKYNYKLQHPKHRVSTWLWKHARHPNYLGEMLVWRWIFVMTIPLLTWMQWLSVISPLFIMILLLYISGIPLLEKQHDTSYGKNKDYITYKKSTSLLIPRPRKK
jgi:steroid 5-alpha reductase family enzyme